MKSDQKELLPAGYKSDLYRHFILLSLYAIFFLALIFPVQSVSATQQSDNNYANRIHTLLQKAQTKGEVPVIIKLNINTQPEGVLSTAAAKQNQRDTIKNIQNQVLKNLNRHDAKRTKKFKYLPYVAMSMDAAGLEAVLTDPDVTQVYEDKLSAPTLIESTPLMGASDAWTSGYSGNGQVVAVLDTGVESSHSFLSGKVIHEACYSTTYMSYNSNTVCPNGQENQLGAGAGAPCNNVDGCEHGTHVAGIVAGKGTLFSGVAQDADIMAIQVFSRFDNPYDCGGYSPCVLTYTSDQISALEHVYEQRDNFNIAAVNMSLGGGQYANTCDSDSPEMKEAIDLLRSVGIATVVASGNDSYTNGISAPACISSAISVGSTTKSDQVSDFSNSAQILDILAPGSTINSSVPNNIFASFSGTSMATPHVAGVFAILRSKAPEASVTEILNTLQSTGVAIIDERNGIVKPRIQVNAALAILGASPSSGGLSVSPPEGFFVTGAEGGPFSPATKTYTVTNTGTETIDFSASESVSWASISPQSGTLEPGNSRVLTISIDSEANNLTAGNYVTVISLTNTTNGQGSISKSLNMTVTGTAAANDKFSDGILLEHSSGSTLGSNENASKESGESEHGEVSGGRSVWWRWIAPATGEVTFDTVGSNFDTTLGAYTGTYVAALTTVAGNDDTYDLQSEITFQTEAGIIYHIAVDGYNGNSGDITFNWSFTQETTGQVEVAVSPETGFATEGPEGGPFSPLSITYTLTNVSSISRLFYLENLPNWLTPSITSGTLEPSASTSVILTVNNNAHSLAPGNYTGTVMFNDVSSRSVFLSVAAGGVISNDYYRNAILISNDLPDSQTGTNVDTSKELGEPDHGGNSGGSSVWWRWTAQTTGIVGIDTFGSSFDTTLGVYTGTQVDNLTAVTSNDDASDSLQSSVFFPATTGTTYYIAVDGYYGDSGAIILNLATEMGVVPANDDFSNAIALSGIPLSISGSNEGASKESGEPDHGGNSGGRSVWWSWTAQTSETVEIDTFGSTFDTILGVYSGTQIYNLTTIVSNDDSISNLQSRVSFQTVVGTTYYVAVDGYGGEVGNIGLNISGAAATNYTLLVDTVGSGSVISNPAGINCQSDCTEDYLNGTTVELTATPDNGWSFLGWSGSCVGTGSCVLSMFDQKSITATFVSIPILTVTINGSGKVISTPPGINCGADCSEAFISATSVTLTPTPSPGWAFNGWTGACSGNGACTLAVTTDTSITATFSSEQQVSLLLVDDDDNQPDVLSYYTAALDALNIAYDIWNTENSDNEPDFSTLGLYQSIIWFTGNSWGEFTGPGAAGETALSSFLDNDGCIAISSQDYEYNRGITLFMTDYLGVESLINDVGQTSVTGSGPFGDLGVLPPLTYPSDNYSDSLTPDASAGVAFLGDQGYSGLYKDSGTYRTTFWTFPFEAITDPGDRMSAMEALLVYCGYVDDSCSSSNSPVVNPQLYALSSADTDRVVFFDTSQSDCYEMIDCVQESRVCNYNWDFGGIGNIVGGNGNDIIVYRYDTSGDYTASLTMVEEESGTTATDNFTVTAEIVQTPLPALNFTTSIDTATVSVTITDLDSSDADVESVIVFWGDRHRDGYSLPATISHTYSRTGTDYHIRIRTLTTAGEEFNYTFLADENLTVNIP
jgi:subtilisin